MAPPLNTPRAKEIALVAVAIAQQQATEKLLESPIGSNRGILIDAFNKFAGAENGSPWCAAFVCACFAEACQAVAASGMGDLSNAVTLATSHPFKDLLGAPEHTKEQFSESAPMRLTASCFKLEQMAVLTYKNWKSFNTVPLPGWIALYRFDGKAHNVHAVPQHAEIVVSLGPAKDEIETVGGNTRPAHGGPGTEQEGVGVYARTRSIEDVIGYIATYEPS